MGATGAIPASVGGIPALVHLAASLTSGWLGSRAAASADARDAAALHKLEAAILAVSEVEEGGATHPAYGGGGEGKTGLSGKYKGTNNRQLANALHLIMIMQICRACAATSFWP